VAGEAVLVVDDNVDTLKLLQLMLEVEGYEVRAAGDAAEALALLERFTPSLILMDLQLPGMDGYELTRRLKADARYAAIPVVAVTAYAMKGDEQRALAAGCDGYLSKPLDTRAFAGHVARFLAGARRSEP
jgi:CheY-like chemotaxis protein